MAFILLQVPQSQVRDFEQNVRIIAGGNFMDKLTFSEYFRENYFPISVNIMTLRGNEGYCGDKTRVGFHAHDFSEIVLLLKGTIIHHCNHQDYLMQQGDFLILHPGIIHSYSGITAETHCCNILYDANIPIPMLMLNHSPFLQLLYPGGDFQNEQFGTVIGSLSGTVLNKTNFLLKMMQRELAENNEQHTTILISLFCAIIVQFIRNYRGKSVKDENWTLNKVISIMKARASEQGLSLAGIAQTAGMSPRTLLRRFHAAFGIGPMEYLQKLRVGNAVTLLKNTSLTNENIASQCGFYNASHMWRTFKRQMECTPSDIRRKYSS